MTKFHSILLVIVFGLFFPLIMAQERETHILTDQDMALINTPPSDCSIDNIHSLAYQDPYDRNPSDFLLANPDAQKEDIITPRDIVSNFNAGGVMNSPTKTEAPFLLKRAYEIMRITTYHWNNGKGMLPGTIMLKDGNGNLIGHWQARSRSGQGSAVNVYWDVFPNIILKPGRYLLSVSMPGSWSWNSATGGSGMFQIYGRQEE